MEGRCLLFSPAPERQVKGYNTVGSREGKSFPGEGGERAGIFHSATPAALRVWLHPCIPPALPMLRGTVREATQLPYPVRLQLLALAQATQERFLLPTQGLPGGEEDCAPHIEPHPFGMSASGWWDAAGAA